MFKKPSYLSIEEKENLYPKMKLDYINGMSVKEIAEKYNFKPGNLYKIIKLLIGKLRDSKFKNGANSWGKYTKEESEKRKKSLSKRLTKYNPMFNEDAQLRSHYRQKRKGKGYITHRQRNSIKKKKGCCELCNIEYPLIVHHRDDDRYNQEEKNLQVVCCNCHYTIHHGSKEMGAKWLK